MTAIASSVFRMVPFPHQEKIVTIDQLDFFFMEISSNYVNNVLLLGHFDPQYENIGVGLLKYSLLIWVFPLTLLAPSS